MPQQTVVPIDLSISFSDVPGLANVIRRAANRQPLAYHLEGTIGVDAGQLGQPVFGPMTLLHGEMRGIRYEHEILSELVVECLLTEGRWTSLPAIQGAGGQLNAEEAKIVAFVDADNDAALKTLEQIVDINSGTQNFEGVRDVGKIFQQEFDALGFNTAGSTVRRSSEPAISSPSTRALDRSCC